ncbi:hypothetical protein J6590_061542, partial [Homalodisca vitripennis]
MTGPDSNLWVFYNRLQHGGIDRLPGCDSRGNSSLYKELGLVRASFNLVQAAPAEVTIHLRHSCAFLLPEAYLVAEWEAFQLITLWITVIPGWCFIRKKLLSDRRCLKSSNRMQISVEENKDGIHKAVCASRNVWFQLQIYSSGLFLCLTQTLGMPVVNPVQWLELQDPVMSYVAVAGHRLARKTGLDDNLENH